MLYIYISNLGANTWKIQETPQYGDSHLTELVNTKSGSKASTCISIIMGSYIWKKKKKKEILKNSWEDIHQRSLQTIPDPKCSEPSVLHYTVIMKTNTDKFYTLRPTAYLNYWEKMVARGALWVWIFWIFCC